ncbi:pentapeptide repeat-containing protein [Saccharopolyspora sp. 5N102]|uniref:pentapeptide repeat-containing protein n=1 Tax=Saccharopolyspora sp. 5N102 TaxID=3375155 RepID=UPI0037A2659F
MVVTVTGGSMGLLLWQFWGAPPVTTLDVIRTAGSLGIGTGGGVALLLAARRQRSIELDLIQKRESHRLQEKVAAETKSHQERLAADNRHDSEERRITELQAKAGEQLGSEQAPVRLNGMYSLERLANNYPQLRQTIVNLICAYLRMPFEPPHGTGTKSMQSRRLGLRTRRPNLRLPQDPSAENLRLQRKHEEVQVRITAQRILAQHLRPAANATHEGDWKGYWGEEIRIDLAGATLIDFDFMLCRVREANFERAKFVGSAKFDEFQVDGDGVFTKAFFEREAYFHKTMFRKCARFDWTKFERGADFSQAHFGGMASFGGVSFRGAYFGGSKFDDVAHFEVSEFAEHSEFGNIKVAGSGRFNGSVFLGPAWFGGANFGGHCGFNQTSFENDVTFYGGEFRGPISFYGAKARVSYEQLSWSSDDPRKDGSRCWPPGWTFREVSIPEGVHIPGRDGRWGYAIPTDDPTVRPDIAVNQCQAPGEDEHEGAPEF